MPHIDVSLYAGRTPEIKKEMADKIAKFFIDELGFQDSHVSVTMTDTDKETFTEDVKKRIGTEGLVIESELITK